MNIWDKLSSMNIWNKLFGKGSRSSPSSAPTPEPNENRPQLDDLLAPDLKATLKKLGGEHLLEKAQRGDPDALYTIGEIYFRGHDTISNDFALAGRCFRLAAEGGNDEAYGALCNCALKNQEALDELIDYCAKYVNERDKMLKLLDMEEEEREHIITACGTCIHMAYPDLFTTNEATVDTRLCHHYDDGKGAPRRTIAIPPAESMKVFCPSWRSEQLLKLIFLHGMHPGGIGGGVRRPRLTAPPGGRERLEELVS